MIPVFDGNSLNDEEIKRNDMTNDMTGFLTLTETAYTKTDKSEAR